MIELEFIMETSPLPPKRYYSVQALRGFSALLVVFYHSTKMIHDRIEQLFGQFLAGGAGVDVFFAISGFVIVITSASDWEKPKSWIKFLWRRLVHIIPLYWLLTSLKLFTLLASPALAQHSAIDSWHIIASFLFIPAWNVAHQPFPLLAVGWTLSYEMLFYLIFAIALGFHKRPVIWVSALLLVLAIAGLWRTDEWEAVATLLNPVQIEFIFGMWIAYATMAGWRLPAKLVYCIIPAMIAVVIATNVLPEGICIKFRVIFWGIPGALLLISAISLEERFQSSLRGFPSLLGNATYAIYLVHGFVLPFIGIMFLKLQLHSAFGNYLVLLVCLTSSVIVGILLHLWIEQPLNTRLRRITV